MKAGTVKALLNMTVANGCTFGEAAAAIEALRRLLVRSWRGSSSPWSSKFARQQLKAEIVNASDALAAAIRDEAARKHLRRAGWEFRRCGKRNCHCSRARGGPLHGPYHYNKRRTDKRRTDKRGMIYSSVYRGKR